MIGPTYETTPMNHDWDTGPTYEPTNLLSRVVSRHPSCFSHHRTDTMTDHRACASIPNND